MFDTLFERLRGGEEALAIVNSWIRYYIRNKRAGRLELIHFFLHSAGCTGQVSSEALRDYPDKWQRLIQCMTPPNGTRNEQGEANLSLSLIDTGQQKVSKGVTEFVKLLVAQCQPEILFDNYLMDGLISFLIELSSTHQRAFRYAATFTASTLLVALANVFLSLRLDSEDEEDVSEESNRRAHKIQDLMNNICKNAYIQRVRDVCPKVRMKCLQGLVQLMLLLPSVFLNERFLKHFRIVMYDKDKAVRLACLKEIITLYCCYNTDPEKAEQLRTFARQTKDRVVEMTRDEDYRIGVQAVKLITQIYHASDRLLTEKDKNEVYTLVYSIFRPVGLAAGEFLFCVRFGFGIPNPSVSGRPSYRRSGIRPSESGIDVIDLLRFHAQFQVHDHVTYLADSVWNMAMNILTNWSYMNQVLLGEPYNERERLNPNEKTIVIGFLVNAVKRVYSWMPPEGRLRSLKKTGLTKADDVEREDLFKQTTKHFILHTPKLLEKYSSDQAKLVLLVQIPRFIELKIYKTTRRMQCLTLLLEQLSAIVVNSTDAAVLEQVSLTFRTLAADDHIGSETLPHLVTAVESWILKFNDAKDALCAAGTDADNGTKDSVTGALLRLFPLFLYNNVLSHVKKLPEIQLQFDFDVSEKLMVLSLKIEFLLIKYKSVRAEQKEVLDYDEVYEIHKQAHAFYERSSYLLTASPQSMVKEASYAAVCDYLSAFGLEGASKDLKSPVRDIPINIQEHLVMYVVFNVCEFVSDNEAGRRAQRTIVNQHRELLSAICRLITSNLISPRIAAPIFNHYIKIEFQNEYKDIVKTTIKSLEANKPRVCGRLLAYSLIRFYEKSGTIRQVKKLASYFALLLDINPAKSRYAVAELHRCGMQYVFSDFNESRSNVSIDVSKRQETPTHLDFLSVLQMLSRRVSKQDGKVLLKYLNKTIEPTWRPDEEESGVINKYKKSLKKSSTAGAIEILDESERNLTFPLVAAERESGVSRRKRRRSV